MPITPGPSPEAYADAESDDRPIAVVLATLPNAVLDRLLEVLRSVGGMSQPEKVASRNYLATVAMDVAIRGTDDELPSAQVLNVVVDLINLTYALATPEAGLS